MNTLLFILMSYGISNIIVYGSIFNGLREVLNYRSPDFFGKLVSCMMCFPTWAGFFMSLVYFSPSLYYGLDDFWFFPKEFLSVFFDGMLASATTWLIHTTQEMMERAFQEE
jgi:hypothetical protein